MTDSLLERDPRIQMNVFSTDTDKIRNKVDSRKHDVISTTVFDRAFLHPVCGAKYDVVRERPLVLVRSERISRRYSKRAEHVLEGRWERGDLIIFTLIPRSMNILEFL